MKEYCRVSIDENNYQKWLCQPDENEDAKIDWSTAEIVITERDGCDIYGYIEYACDTLGHPLDEKQLDYWGDTNEFYDKIYSR